MGVVSQTWAEVHRVNSRVRDALKSKGLLGASDAVVQALDKLDFTNAQKRDERFYPKDAPAIVHWRWNLRPVLLHTKQFVSEIGCTAIYFVSAAEPPTTLSS